MSNEGLLVILVVGLVAGRLAGQIVRGSGLGIIGDLVIGILGAFVGNWLLLQFGGLRRRRPQTSRHRKPLGDGCELFVQRGGGMELKKQFRVAECMEMNRCNAPSDRWACMVLSRFRNGRWLFLARLLRSLCGQCSRPTATSVFAAL